MDDKKINIVGARERINLSPFTHISSGSSSLEFLDEGGSENEKRKILDRTVNSAAALYFVVVLQYRQFLILSNILMTKNLWFSQATYLPYISNVRMVYEPKDTASPFMPLKVITNSKFEYNNQLGKEWKFRSPSEDQFIKKDGAVNQLRFGKHEVYYAQKHSEEAKETKVDFKNDLICFYKMYQKDEPKYQFQPQHFKLENKPELNAGYLDFSKCLYQNSNDCIKAQNLTAYGTQSQSHVEMHFGLQHHQQLNGNKQSIVPHAADRETSPTTSNLFKSYNLNCNTLKCSNQYVFAPKRSSNEKELSHSSKILPYPPSFISITTTTETPAIEISHKAIDNKLPDIFLHRQYKSLWDSYIPSWEIAKMLQQFQSKNELKNKNENLHTLVLIKPLPNYRKRVNQQF